jgi:hypothetical protein
MEVEGKRKSFTLFEDTQALSACSNKGNMNVRTLGLLDVVARDKNTHILYVFLLIFFISINDLIVCLHDAHCC